MGEGLYADGSIETGPNYVTLTQASGGALTNSQGTLWIYPTLVNAQKIYLYTVGYPPPNVCTVFDVTGRPACPTIIINPQLFIQTSITGGYNNGGPIATDQYGNPIATGGYDYPLVPITQYTLAVADNVAAGSDSAALVLSYGTSGSPTIITVPATASSAAQESAYSMFYSQFNSVQSAQSVNNQNLYNAATLFSIAQQASAAAAASAAMSSYQSAASAASASASAFISSYLASQSAASQSANSGPIASGPMTSGPINSGPIASGGGTSGIGMPTTATVTAAAYMPKRVVRHDSSLSEGVKTSIGNDRNKGFDPRKIFARRRVREEVM